MTDDLDESTSLGLPEESSSSLLSSNDPQTEPGSPAQVSGPDSDSDSDSDDVGEGEEERQEGEEEEEEGEGELLTDAAAADVDPVMTNIVAESDLDDDMKSKITEDRYGYTMQKFHMQFTLESYYDFIIPFTIPTVFIPLSVDEVKRLGVCVDAFYRNKEVTYDEQLVAKLDEVIDSHFQQTGCFVKLSTRSPKDAFYHIRSSRLDPLVIEELDKYADVEFENIHEEENAMACAYSRAYRRSLRMDSGKDAFEFMVRSHRIREDVVKWLAFPGAFKLSFVVRQWRVMDPSSEFRGFVYQKNLTALGQYCYMEFFREEILERREEIAERVRRFHDEKLRDAIPHESYIVDFCVTDDEILVIELNPFFNGTGAGLFGWSKDQGIIKGESTFEFRVVEECREHLLSKSVPIIWADFIRERRGIPDPGPQGTQGSALATSKKKCSLM